MKEEYKEWYVADFETTSALYYDENGISKVWLYAICDKDENIVNIGSSIYDFFNFIKTLTRPIIYFHNLKFDGSFILSYLNKNKFRYVDNLKVKDNSGYSTLIGEMGEFYEIKMNFARSKQVVFRDSLKLLPFSVDRIAKDFGFDILKEHIDYEDYEINDEKISYITHDVKIVARALKIFKDNGMKKMTTASCAYEEFRISQNQVDLLFPSLSDDFLDKYRLSYRGGRSQVNPIYQNKILKNVRRYDINSMYPYVMRECKLPYGEPIKIDKVGLFKFELYEIDIDFKLKRGHLPTLLKKGSIFGTDTYYKDSEGVIRLCISSIDLELLQKHYNIYYIKFIEMWGFHTTSLIFRKYVDKYYKLKNESKGALRALYKLLLNSLYGKFGSKNKGFMKIPLFENDIMHFEKGEEKPMKKYYLPMAIAITSYAHKLLDDNICKTGINNFVYCDTDSIHTLGTLPEEVVDNNELGKFKLESIEKKSKYVRQKCYIVKDDNNEINITCSGLPQYLKDKAIEKYKDKIFEEFKVGFSIEGKLLPKQVNGGVILKTTTFKII